MHSLLTSLSLSWKLPLYVISENVSSTPFSSRYHDTWNIQQSNVCHPLVLATTSHLSGLPTCPISITPDELSILVPLSSLTLQHCKTRFHRGTLVSLTSCLRLVADYLPFSRISLLPSVLTTSNFSEVSLRNCFLLAQLTQFEKSKHILPEKNSVQWMTRTPWFPQKLRSDDNWPQNQFSKYFQTQWSPIAE